MVFTDILGSYYQKLYINLFLSSDLAYTGFLMLLYRPG